MFKFKIKEKQINKVRFFFLPLITGVLLFCSCQDIRPIPLPTEGNTYTTRKIDKTYSFPETIKVLSLKRAQQIAVQNSPTFNAMHQAVTAARMRYYIAMAAYAPVVTANYSFGDSINKFKNSSTLSFRNHGNSGSINATWLVFNGLARTMNMLSKRHLYKEQKALEENARRVLLKEVAVTYNQILLAIENNRIALQDMAFQRSMQQITQLKYDAGAVPLSELLNFKVLVNVAAGNQISATYNYNIARYTLAQLMGVPESTFEDGLKFNPIRKETNIALTSVDVYLDAALNNRPDLKAYREAVEAAKYDMYVAYGAFSPTVEVFANLAVSDYNIRNNDGTRNYYNSRSFDYGLEVNWVVFNGLQRFSRVRETRALLHQARYQVAEQWLAVIQEVRSAHQRYIKNVAQAKLYETTLSLVTKQRELVAEGYKAGNIELARLNQAQLDLILAETNFVTALIDIKIAKAQLDAATNTNIIGIEIDTKDFNIYKEK